jgi:hypothetical protein
MSNKYLEKIAKLQEAPTVGGYFSGSPGIPTYLVRRKALKEGVLTESQKNKLIDNINYRKKYGISNETGDTKVLHDINDKINYGLATVQGGLGGGVLAAQTAPLMTNKVPIKRIAGGAAIGVAGGLGSQYVVNKIINKVFNPIHSKMIRKGHADDAKILEHIRKRNEQ